MPAVNVSFALMVGSPCATPTCSKPPKAPIVPRPTRASTPSAIWSSRGDRRTQQGTDIHNLLKRIDISEAGAEGQRQQEREQDLHSGLGDPQLLQQVAEVAVQPFGLRLVRTCTHVRHG